MTPDHPFLPFGAAPAAAPALRAPGRPPLSHGALAETVEAGAARLHKAGARPRDAVALLLPNGPELAVAILAATVFTAAAPLNPAYSEAELRFYLQDLRARVLIADARFETSVRGIARELGISVLVQNTHLAAAAGMLHLTGENAANGGARPPANGPDDRVLLLHTSGTTARPKLVALKARNLAASSRVVAQTLELGPQDTGLNIMPLFHIHGLVTCLAAPLLAGGAVACAPGFEPPRFFSWLNESGTTWYSAVPTMHRIILNRAAKRGDVALARLRFVRSSSAALPEAVYRGLEELFGCPVIEAYGMTEASHQIASNALPPGERKSGSVGRPTGTDIRIFSPDGDALPAGARGEIAIRGAGVHEGYVDNEEANSASFRDGWFLTGDEGFMSTDRELTLTGRLKEIINRGGEKISPLETDRALAEHPDVVQAVTFAVPHPRLGEEVAAAVVRRHGSLLGEQALRAFLSGRLAAFKIPRRIVFLDDIPLGPTGKIQRTGLAQRLGLADPT